MLIAQLLGTVLTIILVFAIRRACKICSTPEDCKQATLLPAERAAPAIGEDGNNAGGEGTTIVTDCAACAGKHRPHTCGLRGRRSKSTKVESPMPNELAAGARIRVYWPAMDEWYCGSIKSSAVQDGVPIHQIRYDDKCVEWRELSAANWERLPDLPPKQKRAAVSPVRDVASVMKQPTRSAAAEAWLSPLFEPSAQFRSAGYELHEDFLDRAAIEALRGMAAGPTRPINGEAARRQRPLEAGVNSHTHALRCLDAFLGERGLLAFEPSILHSTREAQRQRAHRDRGEGSLIVSFHEGTHLWVAAGSHLQPTSDPSEWEPALRRVDIEPGTALIWHPALVHAGGDSSCPPRMHSYTLRRDRDRAPADGMLLGAARASRPMRGDFGIGSDSVGVWPAARC